MRIAIFEDNKNLRQSLSLIVNHTPGLSCTGAFPDCTNLIDDIQQSNPDVILMDIDMPVVSGIEAVGIVSEKFPQIKVIMQTIFDDSNKIFAAIKAGAAGYLLKNTSPAKLVESINEVVNGGAPMSASVALKVLQFYRDNSKVESQYHLSPREKELLHHLVNGQSYKFIAEELFISLSTVQTHIRNIYDKLQVNSKAQAVAKTLRERLL